MKRFKFFYLILIALFVSFSACDDDDNGDDNGNGNGDTTNPADTIAASNLVAYFKFDGDVTDEKGHTTTSEGVTYTFDRHSNPNAAYKGSETAFVKIANADNLKLGSMTLSMWLRAQNLEGGTNFIISFIDPTMDWNAGYGIWQEGTERQDTLRYKAFTRHMDSDMFIWTDTRYDGAAAEVFFPTAKWFHLVYAYDGGTSERFLYFDGNKILHDTILAGTAPMGPITVPPSALDFYIGKNPNTVHEWLGNYEGDLDDLRIYDKALKPEQVEGIFEGERPQ